MPYLLSSGWSLGEHGEFCKFENLEVVTRIPLVVYVPGLTDRSGVQGKENRLQTSIFPFIDVLKSSTSFVRDPGTYFNSVKRVLPCKRTSDRSNIVFVI